MKWINVSKIGMPTRNGRYIFRFSDDSIVVDSVSIGWTCILSKKNKPTHWMEIKPACCQCGKVDGVDYCCEGDCLPF